MTTKVSFGQWLTEQLSRRNMRPNDLVRATGLDSAVVSNLMTGKRNAGTKTCKVIAKALDMSINEVYQAAGLLDPTPDSPAIKSVVTILSELRPDDILEVLEYVRLKKRLNRNKDPAQRRPNKRNPDRTISA